MDPSAPTIRQLADFRCQERKSTTGCRDERNGRGYMPRVERTAITVAAVEAPLVGGGGGGSEPPGPAKAGAESRARNVDKTATRIALVIG